MKNALGISAGKQTRERIVGYLSTGSGASAYIDLELLSVFTPGQKSIRYIVRNVGSENEVILTSESEAEKASGPRTAAISWAAMQGLEIGTLTRTNNFDDEALDAETVFVSGNSNGEFELAWERVETVPATDIGAIVADVDSVTENYVSLDVYLDSRRAASFRTKILQAQEK